MKYGTMETVRGAFNEWGSFIQPEKRYDHYMKKLPQMATEEFIMKDPIPQEEQKKVVDAIIAHEGAAREIIGKYADISVRNKPEQFAFLVNVLRFAIRNPLMIS